ncbi:adenosine kinase [Sinobacterium caligoides]|nr:adenosine kinase [Sinobacterium caligoides]
MSKYDIYGLGAGLVDTEIEVDDAFLRTAGIEKGLMTLVDEARQIELMEHLKDRLVASKRASGGSAANTVIGAAHFGAKNYYSCKLANDENGDFYLADLLAANVDSDQGQRNPGITGKCLVMITPDAERTMNTFLGSSETLATSDLNLEALANAKYFYVEGYVVTSPTGRAAAIAGRQHAEQNAVKTALSLSDPGMVQFFKDGLKEMIGDGVDLLFCNKEEALGWTGSDNIEQAAERLKVDAKQFVITLGADGALLFDGHNMISINGCEADAIDTNGAGDMFAGAFLYALTAGQGFEQAGLLASRSAAQVVSQFGPRLRPEQYAGLKD